MLGGLTFLIQKFLCWFEFRWGQWKTGLANKKMFGQTTNVCLFSQKSKLEYSFSDRVFMNTTSIRVRILFFSTFLLPEKEKEKEEHIELARGMESQSHMAKGS